MRFFYAFSLHGIVGLLTFSFTFSPLTSHAGDTLGNLLNVSTQVMGAVQGNQAGGCNFDMSQMMARTTKDARTGCLLPPTRGPRADRYCDRDMTQMSCMNSISQMAFANSDVYEKAITHSNQPNFQLGIACLKNKEKSFQAMFEQMEVLLDTQTGAMNDLIAKVTKSLKLKYDSLKEIQGFMTGDKGGLTSLQEKDLSQKIMAARPECRDIFGNKEGKISAAKGLLGVRNDLIENPAYSFDAQAQAAPIQNTIQSILDAGGKQGFDDLPSLLSASSEGSIPASFTDVLNKEQVQIEKDQKAFLRIFPNKGLANSVDFSNFSNHISSMDTIEDWHKNALFECLARPGKSKGFAYLTAGINEALERIQNSQMRNPSQIACLENTKLTLANLNHQNFDSTVEAFNACNVPIRVDSTYKNKDGKSPSSGTVTPGDFLRDQYAYCKFHYEKGDGTSKKTPKEETAAAFSKAQPLIASLKKRESPSYLKNLLEARIIHCQGISLTGSPKCAGAVDTKASSFCLKNANDCAQSTQACAGAVEKIIEDFKVKRTELKNAISLEAGNLKQTLLASVNSTKQKLEANTAQLKQAFPDLKFPTLPEGLIDFPESSDGSIDQLGIKIVSLEDLKKSMDLSVSKIAELKSQIEEQKAVALNTLQAQIADSESAWNSEKSFWQGIAEQCKGNIDTALKQAKEMQDAQQKNQAVAVRFQKKVDSYCQRVDAGSATPGCSHLFKDLNMGEVASFLNPTKQDDLFALEELCAGAQADTASVRYKPLFTNPEEVAKEFCAGDVETFLKTYREASTLEDELKKANCNYPNTVVTLLTNFEDERKADSRSQGSVNFALGSQGDVAQVCESLVEGNRADQGLSSAVNGLLGTDGRSI
ncbi:MAG: hypothetical protein KBD63_05935 [Bacteriovoracaceae bacterium]|nr:hypothetical protein [Bacteriovoracaceae bacterium]